MAQICGVINQAHHNHKLEDIKKMYYFNTVESLEQGDKNELNNAENNDKSDFEELESNELISNGNGNWNSTLALWNCMLELENEALREAELDDASLSNSFFDERS